MAKSSGAGETPWLAAGQGVAWSGGDYYGGHGVAAKAPMEAMQTGHHHPIGIR